MTSRGSDHPVEPGQPGQGAGVAGGMVRAPGWRGARLVAGRPMPDRAAHQHGARRGGHREDVRVDAVADGQPVGPQLGVPGMAHALRVEMDLHGGERHVGHPLAEQPVERVLDPAVLADQRGRGGQREGEHLAGGELRPGGLTGCDAAGSNNGGCLPAGLLPPYRAASRPTVVAPHPVR